MTNFSILLAPQPVARSVYTLVSNAGKQGYIGISKRLVDRGCSRDKLIMVIRHELSHACNPGQKHNRIWRAFDIQIGGGEDVYCNDKEIENLVGHKVELFCHGADGEVHVSLKRQNRPTVRFLNKYKCKKCNCALNWRRVVA